MILEALTHPVPPRSQSQSTRNPKSEPAPEIKLEPTSQTHKTDAHDCYCLPCGDSSSAEGCARDRRSHHTRQEVAVDLKSNIFWAIASLALMASALYVDQGPAVPLMAEFSELARDSAG